MNQKEINGGILNTSAWWQVYPLGTKCEDPPHPLPSSLPTPSLLPYSPYILYYYPPRRDKLGYTQRRVDILAALLEGGYTRQQIFNGVRVYISSPRVETR